MLRNVLGKRVRLCWRCGIRGSFQARTSTKSIRHRVFGLCVTLINGMKSECQGHWIAWTRDYADGNVLNILDYLGYSANAESQRSKVTHLYSLLRRTLVS